VPAARKAANPAGNANVAGIGRAWYVIVFRASSPLQLTALTTVRWAILADP
jgi:hypothetical protein